MAAAIPMVIGAVAGGIQGNQQRKATERFNKGAAEANRFADVTGNRTALKADTSGGFFGGALKGASSFGGLGGGGGTAGAAKAAGSGLMAANLDNQGGMRQPQSGSTFGGMGRSRFA